jgi:hypothetical protein
MGRKYGRAKLIGRSKVSIDDDLLVVAKQRFWDAQQREFDAQLQQAKGGRHARADHETLVAAVEQLARSLYPQRLTATAGAKHIENIAPGIYAKDTRRKLAAQGIQRVWPKQRKGFALR